MRKTCPLCRQTWPDGKDPCGDDILSMRISDFVKGLSPESASMEAETFQRALCDQVAPNVDVLLQRRDDILDAIVLLEAASARLQTAMAQWECCPAVQSIPEFMARFSDGKTLNTPFNRITLDPSGETLNIQSREEAEKEDMTWLEK